MRKEIYSWALRQLLRSGRYVSDMDVFCRRIGVAREYRADGSAEYATANGCITLERRGGWQRYSVDQIRQFLLRLGLPTDGLE